MLFPYLQESNFFSCFSCIPLDCRSYLYETADDTSSTFNHPCKTISCSSRLTENFILTPYHCFQGYLLKGMQARQLYNLITMENISSSAHHSPSSNRPFFAIIDVFLCIVFTITNMHKLFLDFCTSFGSGQCLNASFSKLWNDRVSDLKPKEEAFSRQHKGEENDDKLSREEAKMVMGMLGIFCSPESEDLQESFDFSGLFEEMEPSFEEMKQAFDVFDENRDGFIDAFEVQRILCKLGLNEAKELKNCELMIKTYDANGDGKIDFREFVKCMENCFS